jgi:hypothetical protein
VMLSVSSVIAWLSPLKQYNAKYSKHGGLFDSWPINDKSGLSTWKLNSK